MTEPLDSLDAAFDLPGHISDPKFRGLYEVLVHRLRSEARHLPMNTVQQLLLERIAYNYIVLRLKEAGGLGGFANSSSQKDFNTFWLTMTSEFNRMLGKGDGASVSDRKALLIEIQQIIVKTVATLPDVGARTELLEKMAFEFERVGI